MAKQNYAGTKLAITGAVAGVTMLAAGWLAMPGQDSAGITPETVAQLANTPTAAAARTGASPTPEATTGRAATVAPTVTARATATPITSTRRAPRTSRGS